MIKNVLLEPIIAHNNKLAESYKVNLWDKNIGVVKKAKNFDYGEKNLDKNVISFIEKSINFFTNTQTQVTLYDSNGVKLFSNYNYQTNLVNSTPDNSTLSYKRALDYLNSIFFKEYITENAFKNSIKGKRSHTLNLESVILNGNGQKIKKSLINSYIPMIDSSVDNFSIDGVIVITSDITHQWENFSQLEEIILLAFIFSFLVFSVFIHHNTGSAQRIINQQNEINAALEAAKKQAEKENSAKTDFLANTSHELRTPLNSIIGFSEIMKAETYGKMENERYKNYVNDINESGTHLLSIINDILDFSKVSANKLEVDNVELDLNKIASSTIRIESGKAENAGVILNMNSPKEHIIIKADPKRLKQVFLNLLSNAIKFTPTDGNVTLSIKKNNSKKLVYISIIDTGIGMKEEEIPKALSSFGQIDNKLSRKYEGTGLGLPLTKKLVELMDGIMDIKSTPNVGTEVILIFKYIDIVEV